MAQKKTSTWSTVGMSPNEKKAAAASGRADTWGQLMYLLILTSMMLTWSLSAMAGMTALQSMTGNWKGTFSSAESKTAADIEIVMYQTGQQLRGQLYCQGGTKACRAPGANFIGTVEADHVTARVRYPDGHLCGLTGKIHETNINGVYSCDDAFGTDQGSWQITLDTAGPDPATSEQVF